MTIEERRGRLGLPGVDRVLRSEAAIAIIARYGRPLVVEAIRTALAGRRRSDTPASVESILEEGEASLVRDMQPSQRRVFNLTGTVLHTNLGRAPLSESALEHIAAVCFA